MELSKLGYTNIDALDISQEMLNEAKKTNVYTKLICAPLNEQRNPTIGTGEYHALISAGTLVIAHVRPEALEEMTRMVMPGMENSIVVFVFFLYAVTSFALKKNSVFNGRCSYGSSCMRNRTL